MRIVLPFHGLIKKQQQELHWHRLLATSSRVFSHACSESFDPQPTVANLFVDSFIPQCHVITWPPRDRFQPNFDSANKKFLGSLELFIQSTCSNHRRRVPRMIWFSFLVGLGSPKIWCQTSSLVIRCFHEKCHIERRHLWSNTSQSISNGYLYDYCILSCVKIIHLYDVSLYNRLLF